MTLQVGNTGLFERQKSMTNYVKNIMKPLIGEEFVTEGVRLQELILLT